MSENTDLVGNMESPSTKVEGDSVIKSNSKSSREKFFATIQENFPVIKKKSKKKKSKISKIANDIDKKLEEFYKNNTWISIPNGTGYWVKNEEE